MSKSANSSLSNREVCWVAMQIWAPLGILTLSALAIQGGMPPWGKMWALAAAIYAGFKWATWWRAKHQGIETTAARSVAYLLFWPGMDARAFLDLKKKPAPPALRQWLWASGKVGIGTVLIWGCARLFHNEWLAGWTGMVGLMFLLHFGLLEMLAFFWQSQGVQAQPLMNAPFRATSLGEFWGRRWNSGFRIIAFDLMFQPLRRWMSVSAAMMATFFLSGLIHDLVISVPISGGYGFPTLYFLIQGAGMLIERSAMGKRLLGRNGWRARTFTLVTLIAPGGWLFPPLFVEKVMVPFLQTIKAL